MTQALWLFEIYYRFLQTEYFQIALMSDSNMGYSFPLFSVILHHVIVHPS